jgi:NADH:ubiquinone oxidoreductase subunit K
MIDIAFFLAFSAILFGIGMFGLITSKRELSP